MFTLSSSSSRLAIAVLGVSMFASFTESRADDIVWQQSVNYSDFSDWGPSQRSNKVNSAVADDFDVVGTITRVDVIGFGAMTQDVGFSGIYIDFYAYGADDMPGTLQAEFFIPKGDPRILNQVSSSDFQVELGSAFQATGKHFISVQASGTVEWYWRSANEDAPRGPALYYRRGTTSQWTHQNRLGEIANADTGMTLYGTRTLSAPAITALSSSTLPQAGRLIITGSGFGEEQAGGTVQIGGATAPVSNWSETSITAYVPDSAPIGADNVQVVTTGGASNSVALTVTARPPQVGHIKWRFQADDLYIQSRPAVSTIDGTVYAAGVEGHLYALTPAGGIKWIFNAGRPNSLQPVSTGADGVIYFSVEPFVYAINPDGSLKWTFTDPGFARVFAGPTVGPDGNIYGATEDAGLGGVGAFVLAPNGNLISNLPGFNTRAGYGSIEIAFGPVNHWYFTTNASGAVNNAGAVFAFPLGSTGLIWSESAVGQPRVQPSGNVVVGDGDPIHPGIQAFDQNGALVWRSLGEMPGSRLPGVDAQTALDVGPEGNIYVGTLTFGTGSHLTSLNSDGTLRWQFQDNGIASSPAVNEQNTVVVFSAYDFSTPSRVHALTTAGELLWTENLPAENGGFVHTISEPRFSSDGATTYIGTDVNDYASDPYSYLYAFDTAGATTDTVTITAAQYKISRKQLSVQATSTSSDATLQVFVTSTDTLIGTLTKRDAKYVGKFSWPTNPQSITVKSSAGGSATKTVTAR